METLASTRKVAMPGVVRGQVGSQSRKAGHQIEMPTGKARRTRSILNVATIEGGIDPACGVNNSLDCPSRWRCRWTIGSRGAVFDTTLAPTLFLVPFRFKQHLDGIHYLGV